MNLRLPDDYVRSILATERLDAPQLRAIMRTAYLAGEVDFRDDTAEESTFDGLRSQLSRIAELPAEAVQPISPLPIDDEERTARIREIATELTSRSARELAYSLAYLLTVADVEISPVETRFLATLQDELRITDERAAELAATAATAATPGAGDAS